MKPLLNTTGACVVAFSLLSAATAFAQAPATFLLRSGERVRGDLIDTDAKGMLVTVNGQSQTWNVNDVVVIDFAGDARNFPRNEVDLIGSGSLLVLTNGQTIQGQFKDVGGNRPKIIYFTTGGQDRNFLSNNISRLYLAVPPDSTIGGGGSFQPLPPGQVGTGTMQVQARDGWVSTGLQVRQGEVVTISSNGEVRLSSDPSDTATTAGSAKGRRAARAPMPNELAGALIGRVGNGRPFGIGNQQSFPSPGSGMLYLAVNDDELNDNSGAFGVTVGLQDPTRRNRR
jgi:hypothetical protein